ncbi:GNAT family N-acetyltransferase [Kocuria nitroreducens]|uniref:GNAT family N-acetyltransferase n=1 Tax=Kocuria nitroreducens TaxID=3058914 RepID=UPI0036D80968
MTALPPDPTIRDDEQLHLVKNTDLDRYELWREKQFIGFEGFQDHEDGTVELQHTIIGEQFGRQGYARTLVTLLLDGFREQGVAVRPTCPYVQDFLHRFPQYQDVVAPGFELPTAQKVKEKRRRWALRRAP